MPQLHKPEEHTGLDAVHCCDTAKRQQILEGARRIFLQDGFDGASIGDIVRAAGVSKGTVYAYFPSKEKLFEALMVEDRRNQAEALFTHRRERPGRCGRAAPPGRDLRPDALRSGIA